MKLQKIALAVSLEQEDLNPLYSWGKRFDWSHVNEVHLVHLVKKNITPMEFGLVEMPDEKTFQEMKPSLQNFLMSEAKKIIPSDFKGELKYHVSLEYNAEEGIVEFLRKMGVSLVVVATKGKHGFAGLFHNSLTDHLVKFAPCDVFVVRPESQN